MKRIRIELDEREVKSVVFALQKCSVSYMNRYRKHLRDSDFEIAFDCDWVTRLINESNFE